MEGMARESIGGSETYLPLSEESVLRIFREAGAIVTGEQYILAGGEHTDTYVEKNCAIMSSAHARRLCEDIARRWVGRGIEVVVGPSISGIRVAVLTALELYRLTGRDVLSMFTEKNIDFVQVLIKGTEEIAGKRVLVVDDVGTTGKSLKEVVRACREAGALVVGCQTLIDRSGGRITARELGVESYGCLARLEIVNYPDDGKCPLCENHLPISQRYGYGKLYLLRHPEKAHWGKESERK